MIKQTTILMAIFLVGCELGVTPELWERAEKVCKPHGGLTYFYVEGTMVSKFGFSRVVCDDGTEITNLPNAEEKIDG